MTKGKKLVQVVYELNYLKTMKMVLNSWTVL